MRCDDTISDYFTLNTAVRQVCVLDSTLVDIVLGRMLEMLSCGLSLRTVLITDLDFADDAVIFADTTDVLAEKLESPGEEKELLGFRASIIKTNVQAFGYILDGIIESIPVSDEHSEVTQTLGFISSVIYSSSSCELKVIYDWDELGAR